MKPWAKFTLYYTEAGFYQVIRLSDLLHIIDGVQGESSEIQLAAETVPT